MVGRDAGREGEGRVGKGVYGEGGAECREGADRAGCVYMMLWFLGDWWLVGSTVKHKLMNACVVKFYFVFVRYAT